MATITKRKSGWSVQIRRKGYAPQFKTFPTKAEARIWAREQESQIDQGQALADLKELREVTLGSILQRYRDEVTPRKRGAECETFRLSKMIAAPVCCLSLADLTPSAVAAYRDHRLHLAKPGTVRKELTLMRSAVRLARREWGVVLKSNPVEQVALPIANDARDRRLSSGERYRLSEALKATRNPLIGPLLYFAIETAMRRSELLNLKWLDLDIQNRVARLRQTKNGTARTIPLTDEAIRILQALPKLELFVFPITAIALRHAWDRLRDRAGLLDLHFHDLRHEALSRFGDMGLSALELAVISGHKDIRMLSRYTHLRPSDLALKLSRLATHSQHMKSRNAFGGSDIGNSSFRSST